MNVTIPITIKSEIAKIICNLLFYHKKIFYVSFFGFIPKISILNFFDTILNQHNYMV